MASANKTINLGLNKWAGNDSPKREDFNNDNQIIDEKIGTLGTQMADFVYQTAGGTATAITLTIKGALTNGYSINFIASADNNGAVTTINGKNLYKPNTTTAPTLKSGKAYTIWYNASGDCFFIKASAEGNAQTSDVLAGKVFSNDTDTGLVGTMDLSNLISSNIKDGVNINGVVGNVNVASLGGVPFLHGTGQSIKEGNFQVFSFSTPSRAKFYYMVIWVSEPIRSLLYFCGGDDFNTKLTGIGIDATLYMRCNYRWGPTSTTSLVINSYDSNEHFNSTEIKHYIMGGGDTTNYNVEWWAYF